MSNSPAIVAVWPDLYAGNVSVGPPRNGMDRYTGKLLQGWPHVLQSIELIYATPFVSRVLRRWVGSFVPPILGRNITTHNIATFYWALTSALDLWEPDYKITHVNFMNAAVQSNPALGALTVAGQEAMIRAGNGIFQNTGIYYPRGHLGDFTPDTQKTTNILPVAPTG